MKRTEQKNARQIPTTKRASAGDGPSPSPAPFISAGNALASVVNGLQFADLYLDSDAPDAVAFRTGAMFDK